MHHFGDRREGLHRARAKARLEQQLREVARSLLGRRGQGGVHAPQEHVGRAKLVMARHLEMRDAPQLADDPVGIGRELHLRAARGRRAAVGEVDDRALRLALDGRVRLLDEAAHRLAQPVIPPRRARLGLHALLHHRPRAVARDHEAVQIEREPVLHRGGIDLGDEAAGAREPRAVDPGALTERDQLAGRPPGVAAAASTHGQAQLVFAPGEPALQRPEHAGGDPRRMPIHPQHASQRLEPEGVGQPPQDPVRPFVQHERLDDHGAEPRHPLREPGGDPPSVER